MCARIYAERSASTFRKAARERGVNRSARQKFSAREQSLRKIGMIEIAGSLDSSAATRPQNDRTFIRRLRMTGLNAGSE